MFLRLSDRWAPKEIRRRQAAARESRLVTGDRILQPARGHGDARPRENGSFRKGLSEIAIRVCVGPAGCHLEPSMFIGWQRINPTRESINMSAILHRELLNPCLSKRTNMEATDALCLLSRPPGARGIFKDQACRYITPGRRLDSPFENARLQAKQSPRRGRKKPSLLGLGAQHAGRRPGPLS